MERQCNIKISPQPVMSQPYPVPIPQPKSRPLPDSRGIPNTLNLFFFHLFTHQKQAQIRISLLSVEQRGMWVRLMLCEVLLPTRNKGLHLFSKLYQQISKALKNCHLTMRNQKVYGFPNKKRLKVSGIPRESVRGRDLDCGSGIGTG